MTPRALRLATSRKRLAIASLFSALCLLTPAPSPLMAQSSPAPSPSGLPPILRDVSFTPELNAAVPLDLEFRDETGQAVRLADYFQGKPVILVLAYYQCPMLCDQVLHGLASSLKTLSFNAGDKFEVVVVSFNPRETPNMAADKKNEAVERYGREGTAKGFHFLTGEQSSIATLTRAAGFRYAWDAQANIYAHASGILILTPEGRISRYFYGIEYAPRDVRLGLVEASANKIGTAMDRVLLFCYHYDPATGKYGALVMNLVRGGGILTLLALGFVVFAFLRRERRSPASDRAPQG